MPTVTQQIRGLPQLFRVKPVLSWGVAALLLGTAVAYARVGEAINLFHGGLAAVLVLVAQGVVSHGFNDAYDWLTGTDKESIGKGTGGSRVIPDGKMTVVGTLVASIIGVGVVLVIGGYFISIYGTPMVALLAVAIWSPVSYSLPPLKLGYRPFNELFVVLPALTGVVVGTDMVLSGSVSWLAAGVGLMHAMFCISWFIVSRIPDYKPDKKVGKTTTVVYVGLENSRVVSWAYLTVGGLAALYLVSAYSPVFAVAGPAYVAMVWYLGEMDPFNPHQASTTRLKAMHTTTLNAIAIAIGLAVFGV